MPVKTIPIPKKVKKWLHYDPETGIIIWKKKKPKVKKGQIAGGVSCNGYLQIKFEGVMYQSHRIAWFLQTGEQPPKEVDHDDRDKSNNKWKNLRKASSSDNSCNKSYPLGRSGIRGVCWLPNNNKWIAKVMKNGITHHKSFALDQLEEAEKWAIQKRKKLHGEFANAKN